MSDTSPSKTVDVRVDERTNMIHYIIPGEYLPPEMVEAIGEQITRELCERGIKAFNAPHTKVHDLVVQPEA